MTLDLTTDSFGPAQLDAALKLFSESDLREIEAQFGLESPHSTLRNELAHLLWKTLRNYSMAGADPKATKAIVQGVYESASALRDYINPMLTDDSGASHDAAFLLVAPPNRPTTISFNDLGELAMLLEGLVDAAAAVEGVAPKAMTGKPRDLERYALLRQLHDIVFKFNGSTTGKKYSKNLANTDGEIHRGPLFLMFRELVSAIATFRGEAAPNDEALFRFIERWFAAPATCPRCNSELPEDSRTRDPEKPGLITFHCAGCGWSGKLLFDKQ
jgi:hypothetical protein